MDLLSEKRGYCLACSVRTCSNEDLQVHVYACALLRHGCPDLSFVNPSISRSYTIKHFSSQKHTATATAPINLPLLIISVYCGDQAQKHIDCFFSRPPVHPPRATATSLATSIEIITRMTPFPGFIARQYPTPDNDDSGYHSFASTTTAASITSSEVPVTAEDIIARRAITWAPLPEKTCGPVSNTNTTKEKPSSSKTKHQRPSSLTALIQGNKARPTALRVARKGGPQRRAATTGYSCNELEHPSTTSNTNAGDDNDDDDDIVTTTATSSPILIPLDPHGHPNHHLAAQTTWKDARGTKYLADGTKAKLTVNSFGERMPVEIATWGDYWGNYILRYEEDEEVDDWSRDYRLW